MRIICLSLVIVILVSTALCKEENDNKGNVENLKTLRQSVTFAYKAGNYFLDLIRGSTPPHEPLLHAQKVFNNKDNFKLTDFLPIYRPYIGYICLLLAGLLFLIFVPIVGFCFCLCRCSGKCGGKIKGMDTKHAICKRYTYAIFLGLITIIQLAGIVLAFINNHLIHEAMVNKNEDINAVTQVASGTQMFRAALTNISEAIKASERSPQSDVDSNISNTDFMTTSCDKYFITLNTQTENLKVGEDLRSIETKLRDLVDYLDSIKVTNPKLKSYLVNYRSEINKLKINNIRPQVCDMLNKTIDKDFDVFKSSIRQQIKVGSTTGQKLQDIVNLWNKTAMKFLDEFNRTAEMYMKLEYLEYRMYICIVVCCLMLLIVIFYFLGLCFGQCGERPFEDAKICNRGVGANLMMAGVAFAFLFTPLIMVVEVSFFMVGGSTQTEFCRYATNSYSPGISTFDVLLRSDPKLEKHKNNMFDKIINKCPSESMAVAFGLDKDVISEDVKAKVAELTIKVKKIPQQSPKEILDNYFKVIEQLVNNIKDEIKPDSQNYEGFDDTTKQTIRRKMDQIRFNIEKLSFLTVKEKYSDIFYNAATEEFSKSLISKANDLLVGIYINNYRNVRCDGVYRSTIKLVDAACVTFLWPFNGFWFGIGICLVLTIPSIIFAVKLAGLYRRTEKYSPDYEEPDYHSYMGFYTNNAENIPMKRPKSGKSNKNRNSNPNNNSNNKESLKQNNPQYLPVYPYDAYE